MKRRVAAILEFVGQLQQTQTQQTQQNGKNSGNGSGNGTKGANTPLVNGQSAVAVEQVKVVQGLLLGLQEQTGADEKMGQEGGGGGGGGQDDMDGVTGGEMKVKMREDGEFRGLESGEMMKCLVGELEGWQRVFGVYSR